MNFKALKATKNNKRFIPKKIINNENKKNIPCCCIDGLITASPGTDGP